MKKIILALFALSIFPLFAELHPTRRYVEVGLSVDAMACQNVMPLTEIFKKNLVIDLRKIYSDMDKNGATFAFCVDDSLYFDVNLEDFRLGFHLATEVSANINLSKDLFEVLDGIYPGVLYQGEASVWAESFATFSVPVSVKLDKWRLKLAPTCFVPFVYVPATTVKGYAMNGVDGSIVAKAQAQLDFYTIGEFKGLVTDGELSTDVFKNFEADSILSNIASSAGFDLSAEVEYQLFDSFDLGGYITAPIIPGHLRHKVSTVATASVQTDSLLGSVIDEESPETDAKFGDAYYSSCNYVVNRPLKFGLECAWRPFGKWLTLRGLAGAALRNPFGGDVTIKSFYPEYKLGIDLEALGMFGLSLYSQYTKKVFAHGLGIMLNFRAVELDVNAAICSPSFVQSFKGYGLTAGVGLKFGW